MVTAAHLGRAFRWTPAPWGLALCCLPLDAVADHVVTTRQLGLAGDDDERPWGLIARRLGIKPDALARARQVHGARALALRGPVRFAADQRPEADALLTEDPALGLAVQVADCVPILLADVRSGAVAAVHAGWRGTRARVVARAVTAMRVAFDTRPRDLLAAVGPSIGPCCYEVGDEVEAAFAQAFPRVDVARWFVRAPRARPHLNLWVATEDQLAGAGLSRTRIFTAGLCTADHLDVCCSYRAEGPGTGRMAAAIRPRRGG